MRIQAIEGHFGHRGESLDYARDNHLPAPVHACYDSADIIHATPAHHRATRYTITDLGTLGDDIVGAACVNNLGVVVGSSSVKIGEMRGSF